MPKLVQLASFTVRDIPTAETVRVVRLDCESFDVRRVRREPDTKTGRPRHQYAIWNRTHFAGGWRYADTLAEVRRIIAKA